MVEHIPSSVRCYRLIKSQLERAPSCTVQCILYVLCTSMYTGLHRGNNIGRWPRIAGIPEGDHRWTRSWCRWRLPDDAHGARWFPQRLSIENCRWPWNFLIEGKLYVDNGVPLPFSLSLSSSWQKKLNKLFAEDLRREGSRSRLKSKRIRFQCNL